MSWTIVGGGIHAVTIAIKLRASGLPAEALTIIDPHDSLCEQFDDFSCRIGMPFLRSPHVHHVHPDPFHLKKFAKHHQYTGATYGKYQRPQRDMFMDHVHKMLNEFDLNSRHIKDIATNVEQVDGQWKVDMKAHDSVISDHLLLAIGSNNIPHIPDMYQNQPDVQHIFDDTETPYHNASHVIGSGITAAHLTLKLIEDSASDVIHLWMNKDIEVYDFDADPGWLGPKKMTHYREIDSSKERLNIIAQERHKGSMPKELYLRLKKHVQEGQLQIHVNEIKDIKDHQIITDKAAYDYDTILLATGFKNNIMQLPVIQNFVQHNQAPLTETKHPKLSESLEWMPGVFVSGALADIELGPFARSFAGGREAADRIAKAYLNENVKVS
ncbi:FAD/NAD(P)-binding protein [Staphylococcus simulans]|uniref:FAD/NAD(P)-binding protein n=1 Tax=Staphylococcus simulans TaxID=1286 RepID=UPI003F7DBB2B